MKRHFQSCLYIGIASANSGANDAFHVPRSYAQHGCGSRVCWYVAPHALGSACSSLSSTVSTGVIGVYTEKLTVCEKPPALAETFTVPVG